MTLQRIEHAIEKRRADGKKALVTYLTVGDPDEAESIALLLACADEGADILELGCPFSDPSADGPAIARASERALKRGGGLAMTLRVAKAVRAKSDVPIVLFGYMNPLTSRGEEALVTTARESGVDALLIVDLPIDESAELRALAKPQGLGIVPLLAPTSSPERVRAVAAVAREGTVPFVYYVSTMGVTGGGSAEAVLTDASSAAAGVREVTGKPTVVGFGIDGPNRARAAAASSDGVVVGTALVKLVEEGASASARIANVRALVRALRAAV